MDDSVPDILITKWIWLLLRQPAKSLWLICCLVAGFLSVYCAFQQFYPLVNVHTRHRIVESGYIMIWLTTVTKQSFNKDLSTMFQKLSTHWLFTFLDFFPNFMELSHLWPCLG